MNLEYMRKEIDRIDESILDLLRKRKLLAKDIGNVKRKAGMPIRDDGREAEVLERIRLLAQERDLDGDAIADAYRRIIRYMRESQES